MNNTITTINPYNPAHYLAACGLFEIVSLCDRESTAYWQERDWLYDFIIASALNESRIVEIVRDVMTDLGRWDLSAATYADDVIEIAVRVSDHRVRLNFWWESIGKDGNPRIRAWRLSIRPPLPVILRGLIDRANQVPVSSCADIWSVNTEYVKTSQATLNINPDTTTAAGYSRNESKLPPPVWPYVELLAMVAMQRFFPPRCRPGRGIASTRGWEGDKNSATFTYHIWLTPLPVILARAAANIAPIGVPVVAMNARRDGFGESGRLMTAGA